MSEDDNNTFQFNSTPLKQDFNTREMIIKATEFFDEYKTEEIQEMKRKGFQFLKIDFFEVLEFDIELAEYLLEYPKDIISIFEISLKDMLQIPKAPHIWLTSLPDNERVLIRDIRAEHIGKLVKVEGIVRRKTDVRPRLLHIEYLCTNPSCPFCEEKLKIPQLEDKARILKACPKCKSPVDLVHKELVDSQSLVLEELPEQLENSADQPKRLNVLLKEDLVSPFKDSKSNPGSKVYVVGFVKEIPIPTRTGGESVNFELVIDGLYIDLVDEDYSEINISPEELEQIQELSKKENIREILTRNFAPSIYGAEKIKEAILLQQFGGSINLKSDGVKTRGDIHILLIGDPGAAKSQMLKAATRIAPKASFVSGKSASAAGLTATVLKDELTKGWALEAGAMVLASGGLCAIDELDKMSDEDTSAMHEALEQQTISIAKANIRATLRCETTVLGAANPKLGRFDPYGDITKQINFPPALLSRFDLIFILQDEADRKKDDLIANHILQAHKDKSLTKTELSSEFMKKYIAQARKLNPQLTQEAIVKIKDFYVNIRNAGTGAEEGRMKSVPITARQLEAIVRLGQAFAKVRLHDKVTEQYAQEAIELLMYCLEKIGIDPKTGEMDIDRITTGVTTSSRNVYRQIVQIIDTLEQETPEITYDAIVESADKKGISKAEVDKIITKLKAEGLIFEPRKNLFKKL
ncbi:MAG: minichromosome maintenance protein MCM [Nanoarchaeota archaeon]|nr:minichromosome maintenance protein MCM [Nanoarchaeota archaeon]